MPTPTTPKPTTRHRDTDFLKSLGARIRKIRMAKGYSLDRVAMGSEGLNRSSVSRIERGLTDPQLGTLKRIADTIGVSVAHLLDITE